MTTQLKKNSPARPGFKTGESIVYPAHGVGTITAIEEQEVVQGKARVKRTMWSRRAQEYDAKINSGDLISIAEVVRDLYRAENQPEQSYSERQLYEAALDRMAREIAAVNKMSETEAVRLVETNLAKGPKRGKAVDEDEAQEEAA